MTKIITPVTNFLLNTIPSVNKAIIYAFLFKMGMFTNAIAETSEHIVLTPKSDKIHSAFQPKLIENTNSPSFVDVQIPFNKGKSYFLITTNKPLLNNELEFRWMIWKNKPLQTIVSISQLKKDDSDTLILTINKDQIDKTYVYFDYTSVVKDGGYYYTYALSKFPIQK